MISKTIGKSLEVAATLALLGFFVLALSGCEVIPALVIELIAPMPEYQQPVAKETTP